LWLSPLAFQQECRVALTLSRFIELSKRLNPFFKSYNLFLQRLREGKYQDFTSTLEANVDATLILKNIAATCHINTEALRLHLVLR